MYGWPSVIRNQPLDLRGEPHPNLYYLTCPWLRKELARLEDSGFISKLQMQVAADAELLNNLRRCQDEHAAEYFTAMQAGGHGPPYREMLIAGASDPQMIKCLHSHMAWYLTHPDYLAGLMVAEAVGELWCPDERCAAWMDEISGQADTSGSQAP
ncbi:MAG: DUF501 domain-containing protein [Thermoleophilia bacterium]